MNGVGERIRERRHALGLSQRDISEPGVSYAYISRVEAGKRIPSVKALRKIAPKLGVSVLWLETGSDDIEITLPRDLVLSAIALETAAIEAWSAEGADVEEASRLAAQFNRARGNLASIAWMRAKDVSATLLAEGQREETTNGSNREADSVPD